MTVEAYSLPKAGITSWFSKFLWEVRDEPFIVTEDDFPAAKLVEWFKVTGEHTEWNEEFMTTTGSRTALAFILGEQTLRPTDVEMDRLKAVSFVGDEVAFTEAVNAMNWENRTAGDFLRATRLALATGAHLKARWLATEGATRYPEHTELQNYAHVLAPPKVISANLPPDPNAAADMHWLKTCGADYRGRWVALRGGVLITTALSWKELLAKLENPKDKSILITPVY